MGQAVSPTEYVIKKFGLENYQGRMPINLDMLRDDLAPMFNDLGLNIGVEIGVAAGRFSEILLTGHPNLQLTCVDPYRAYDTYFDYTRQETMTGFEAVAHEKLSKYGDRVKFIKKFSLDAVKDFPDESLDFVYIDGNHMFQDVVNDTCEWSKKVRKGGIVAGHDFERHRRPAIIHVQEAIMAYTDSFDIKPWFITKKAKRYKQDGNVARTFFWEKK